MNRAALPSHKFMSRRNLTESDIIDYLTLASRISNSNPVDTYWHCILGMLKVCFFWQEVSRPALLWVLGLLTSGITSVVNGFIWELRISQDIIRSVRIRKSQEL